jgi:esterase/lipase superfamily enzyme
MSLITDFKQDVASMVAAIRIQDHASALVHARAARAALIGIPNTELDREKIEFSRDDLDNQIRDLERAQRNKQIEDYGLVQRAPIYHTRH